MRIIKTFKKITAIFLIVCLFVNFTGNCAYANTILAGENDFLSRCEVVNPSNLRVELTGVIQKTFEKEINIDIETTVNSQWMLLHLNDAIDSEIDNSVSLVGQNTNFLNKIESNWNKDIIRDLTNEIVKLTFESSSSEVKNRINALLKNVSSEISAEIENATTISSYQALQCVERFIGRTYSATMLNIFNNSLSQKIDISTNYKNHDPEISEINRDQAIRASIVLTIIGRKIIKDQIEKIGSRIGLDIGKRVLGRIAFLEIPFLGEAIAFVLTAWVRIQVPQTQSQRGF